MGESSADGNQASCKSVGTFCPGAVSPPTSSPTVRFGLCSSSRGGPSAREVAATLSVANAACLFFLPVVRQRAACRWMRATRRSRTSFERPHVAASSRRSGHRRIQLPPGRLRLHRRYLRRGQPTAAATAWRAQLQANTHDANARLLGASASTTAGRAAPGGVPLLRLQLHGTRPAPREGARDGPERPRRSFYYWLPHLHSFPDAGHDGAHVCEHPPCSLAAPSAASTTPPPRLTSLNLAPCGRRETCVQPTGPAKHQRGAR